MSTELITPDVSNRICKHMNEDHANALLVYASHYGGLKNPKKAVMKGITSKAMQLSVDEQMIFIYFDHDLTDSEEAHRTLVSMLKKIPNRPR